MKIAFLGDSITFGYGLADRADRFAAVYCKRTGDDEQNLGITGTLVARAGLSRGDGTAFIDRAPQMAGADIAVIFGGTNDYFWSDRTISGGDDDSYFDHAIETLCRHVQKQRHGKITLFVTPYAHNGIGNYTGGGSWNDASRHDTTQKNFNGHTLSDYVGTIKEICRKYQIPCLDLHSDFDFDWKVHTIDGCHPNEEGHRLLMRAMESKLNMLLKESFK